MAVLAALGFSKPLLARLALTARANGTTVEAELLASGEVEENAYYGAMARMLRLPFVSEIDPHQVVTTPLLDTQLHRPTLLRIAHRHRPQEAAIVPEAARLSEIAAALMTMPALGRNLAVTTPSAVRRAVWKAGEDRRVRETTNSLFEQKPAFSARVVLSGAQGFYGGILLAAIIVCFGALPFETLYCLHVALSFTYFASLILRIVALARRKFMAVPRKSLSQTVGPLPRYTVMVALYREAGMAEQLLRGLERLDWPASLLDIKLVCEADDRETIEALRALGPGPQFEIVEVPAYGPRTKPKALTYALAAARGEFLAIYDAEDRPHPQQLREAYQHFRNAPPELGCLQAPLIITNVGQSWLSALFSLEYSGLFRGLLPMLGRTRMPLPLGGTSNHFRTAALIAAGGWDPYNVTEDADMGIRLYRLGYRSDVIQRQTLEDAPVSVPVWVSQRTRWFKGWVQTWLVLMRDPRRLIRDMGLVPFLILQLLVGGMLVSALLHPLILVFLGVGAIALLEAPANEVSAQALSLFILDSVNIVGSYLTFLGLGIGSMIDHEKQLLGRRWVAVPLYWLMISYAAWRAVLELYRKPFFWSKTPHTPRTDMKGK
ncbi:glycosyltransferase family 2 protein [Neorhizobium alkalisoli]|uniref:Cellulose synthase/poly-beta-1,6-N-acetylglucosamine synthase-like glycosyltransferase n=1 Tax=Neorhizobium alkalisoli TaxID=528178 RepID=A0A561QS23_9HYPH|nr:glycosyltransferase family 2 protein [Neorhizobium alkalisoli]TWF53188.1 cellulose synthase/poly-beta-1,6-N-acetylglucosamine synthase-like glycosyltransferase [Neorhizobium alkalisoli]